MDEGGKRQNGRTTNKLAVKTANKGLLNPIPKIFPYNSLRSSNFVVITESRIYKILNMNGKFCICNKVKREILKDVVRGGRRFVELRLSRNICALRWHFTKEQKNISLLLLKIFYRLKVFVVDDCLKFLEFSLDLRFNVKFVYSWLDTHVTSLRLKQTKEYNYLVLLVKFNFISQIGENINTDKKRPLNSYGIEL